MNNFFVRFLLEVCFELMICALINVTGFTYASKLGWVFSLITLLGVGAAIILIGQMFLRKGPNVSETYASNSLLSSFWQVRPLHENITRQALALED